MERFAPYLDRSAVWCLPRCGDGQNVTDPDSVSGVSMVTGCVWPRGGCCDRPTDRPTDRLPQVSRTIETSQATAGSLPVPSDLRIQGSTQRTGHVGGGAILQLFAIGHIVKVDGYFLKLSVVRWALITLNMRWNRTVRSAAVAVDTGPPNEETTRG